MESYPKQCHCLPEPWKPPRPSVPALPGWTTKTRAQRSVYISHCLLYAQPCGLQAIMCVRCFRARRRKHRQKEVLYKAACNKTLKMGGSQEARVTTCGWRNQGGLHGGGSIFMLFPVKDGRRRGRRFHNRSVWTFVCLQPVD